MTTIGTNIGGEGGDRDPVDVNRGRGVNTWAICSTSELQLVGIDSPSHRGYPRTDGGKIMQL